WSRQGRRQAYERSWSLDWLDRAAANDCRGGTDSACRGRRVAPARSPARPGFGHAVRSVYWVGVLGSLAGALRYGRLHTCKIYHSHRSCSYLVRAAGFLDVYLRLLLDPERQTIRIIGQFM